MHEMTLKLIALIFIIMQIPVLSFILVFSRQSKSFKGLIPKSHLNIVIGWYLNLMYLIIVSFTYILENFFTDLDYIISQFKLVAHTFDFFYITFFYFAIIPIIIQLLGKKNNRKLFGYCRIFGITTLLSIYILVTLSNFYYEQEFLPYLWGINLLQSTAFFSIILMVAFYYLKIEIRNHYNHRLIEWLLRKRYITTLTISQNRRITKVIKHLSLLTAGAIIYSISQFLILFDKGGPIYEFGFFVSLAAKILILLGLYRIIIHHTLNTGESKKLDRIIDSSFHELTPAVLFMSNEILPKIFNGMPPEINYTEKVKLELYKIESTINRMIAVINATNILFDPKTATIMDLTNSDTFDFKVTEESANLNSLMEIAIMNVKILFNDKIDINVDYGKNCNAFCNKNHIIQIFLNLLKNSVEAVVDIKSEILITTRKRIAKNAPVIIVSITDNGVGMTDKWKVIGFIEGKTSKVEGSGYGLPIVESFINELGGYYKIESPVNYSGFKKKGKGTRFTIYLPTNI